MTTLAIDTELVNGPHGIIPVRRYIPTSGAAGPTLVWVHGGSFLGGDLDMPEADHVGRILAEQGIPVSTVGYRLAPVPPEFEVAAGGLRPGVHYPVAVDEIEHVYRQTAARDARKPILGGASAGGALCTSAAVRLRDQHGPAPASLVLVYPLLHRVLPAPSPQLADRLHGEVLEPTPAEVTVMNENYLGPDAAPASIAGAFAGDGPVDGLPPILLIDSEVDPLRASSQHFASAVIGSSGEIHYVVEPGTRHGHLNRPGPAQQASLRRITEWILQPSRASRPIHSEGQPS